MDPEGQRTGVVTNYTDATLSWQHWFSPQIELRPEIAYYRSLKANALTAMPMRECRQRGTWAGYRRQ